MPESISEVQRLLLLEGSLFASVKPGYRCNQLDYKEELWSEPTQMREVVLEISLGTGSDQLCPQSNHTVLNTVSVQCGIEIYSDMFES